MNSRISSALGFLAAAVVSAQGHTGFTDANWANFFGDPGAFDPVTAAAKDSKGNIYIGGEFTAIGTVLATNLAEWNGTNWSRVGDGIFTLGAGGPISALACDNAGDLYIGGSFNSFSGSNVVAKWNGTNWSALGPGLNGSIEALACDNFGNLYVGGKFTMADFNPFNNVIEWNGTNWLALGTGLNNTVNALACDSSGNLYAGGSFTTAGGLAAEHIAEWNGTTWSTLSSGTSGTVDALIFDSFGNLYAGGSFASAGGITARNIAEWNGTGWAAFGSGVQGQGLNAIVTLAFDQFGDLYAAGGFGSGGSGETNLAKWNGSSWSYIGISTMLVGGPEASGSPLIFDNSGTLWAGGSFQTENNVLATYFVKFKNDVCLPVSEGMQPTSAPGSFGDISYVRALAFDSFGNLYVGGQFMTPGGVAATNVARWNGSSWSPLGSSALPISAVTSLTCDRVGNLYECGGTGGVGHIGKWTGTNWASVSSTSNLVAASITFDSTGNLYAGGNFTNASATRVNYVAELIGTKWTALGSGLNGAPNFLVADNFGDVFAFGNFTMAGGINATNVAEWSGSNWLALGPGIAGSTSAACDDAGNLYVGGVMTTNVAEWNGISWSIIGSANGQIGATACDNFGNVYVGGVFTSVDGVQAGNIAQWDGANWHGLGSGTGPEVLALLCDRLGNLYAGGHFTTAGTNVSTYIAEALMSRSSALTTLNLIGSYVNVISGLGTPGYSYALDLATNLTPPVNWMPETTNTLSGMNLTFSITNTNAFPQEFFRARYVPQ